MVEVGHLRRMGMNKTFYFIWILNFFLIVACSSIEKGYRSACRPEEESGDCQSEVQYQGMAAGFHESSTQAKDGLTALWYSTHEDFFVAGLHRNQSPEPPQTGVYLGSISNLQKRTIHWFTDGQTGTEDVLAIRVYEGDDSKKRVYLLSQLQNAGFYFPTFYFLNLDSLMTTAIHPRVNCEQVEDIDFAPSGLNVRCQIPSIGDDSDAEELSMDVDPTQNKLGVFKGEGYRDWLNGQLHSCLTLKNKNEKICFPVK